MSGDFTASRLLLLAIAGATGTVARYWLQYAAQRPFASFPMGTFAVNMLGCLAFGIVWALAEHRGVIGPQARVVILAGFLGAFTTYSGFAFDSAQLVRGNEWALAAVNIVAQNVVGVVVMFAGFAAGRAAL